MLNSIEIIALIYKSEDYLHFISSQLKSKYNYCANWDVTIRIVANDAKSEIIKMLQNQSIPYSIYKDKKFNDYYLNRIYRCWNFAGRTSKAENICFVNSDMMFSKDWLKNLLKHHNGINMPCSRLVESGKQGSGKYGISKNFGRSPKKIQLKQWNKYTETIKEDKIQEGGLFMPCIFNKKRFVESGLYPEGNIYDNGIGNLGKKIKSGDAYFFYDVLEKKYNMKHITVFDSIVYHIQEGEKDE